MCVDFGSLIDRSRSELYVFDVETLRFVHVNRGALENLGYSVEEMRELTPVDIKPDLTRRTFEEKLAPLRRGDVRRVHFTTNHRRKDGSLYVVDVHVQTETQDGREFFVAIILDVTERVRAKEAERRLTAVLELTTDAVCVSNPEGQTTYLNAAGRKLLGFAEEEDLSNVLIADYHPAELASFVAEEVLPTAIEKGVWRGETKLITRSGEEVPCLQVLMAHCDEAGRPEFFSTIVRDIRDLKKAERERSRLERQLQQAQRVEAIGRLAGGVAHDFNNLLTVILSAADELEGTAHDTQRERIAEVRQAADRAATLTRQLLAFGRRQMLSPRVVDLDEILMGVQHMLVRLMPADIDITFCIPRHGRHLVEADPAQLEQVVVNLAAHARDAMQEGGKLRISTALADADGNEVPDGDHVSLSVSDTGVGMDELTQARIFEPFFTLNAEQGGTGLGLATVHGIVKQSGAQIDVHSELEKGSTFIVRFERARRPLASDIEPPMSIPAPGRGVICVAEDEPLVRRSIVRALRSAGYEVLEAADGVTALEVARDYDGVVDLLLTDVVMPKMNGPALARSMVESHPRLKVVFMSGYADSDVFHEGTNMAGAQFVQKPFTASQLIESLQSILGSTRPTA